MKAIKYSLNLKNFQLNRWPFGKIGCIVSGWIMYFIGTVGVYVMVAISCERFLIIYKPLMIKKITHNVIYIIVGVCIFLGIFWSTLPIVGWSYYSVEGIGTSCSVEWADQSFNVVSYNIAMFIFVYFLPLFVIIVSNVKVILIVSQRTKVQGVFFLFPVL